MQIVPQSLPHFKQSTCLSNLVTHIWNVMQSLVVYDELYVYIFFQAVVVSTLLCRCTTWMLTKCMEKKPDGNYTRMLWAILNKSWKQNLKNISWTATYHPSIKLSKLDEPDMWDTAAERNIGFTPFSCVLALCKMLTISSKILSRVVVFISLVGNNYTTNASSLSLSLYIYIYIYITFLLWLYNKK